MMPRPPIETAMFDDGQLTQVWSEFFRTLAKVAGVPGPPGPSGAASPWITDAFAGVYTASLASGWNHQVTATAAIAVQVPTGGTSGQPVKIRVIQDPTGGRPVTLAAGWKNAQADPGYQEALTSCIIDGIFYSPTVVLVNFITENIPA